ncbi:hypothetical protein B5C34_05220 [Pacificimonas flava]|uniref:Phage protein n=2 Tax=Pacificimonas TaxID=1960290 RepID=A0A219B3E9_9SPHN|nr:MULTISPECIES: hypothetical protein [Pacificimonas]MBZ6377381.1 hypothetical protein [Pacificimonas aurantium]OWV32912.1 hypothetical protein B5C34_05220 [Pacificimonas flava]
MNAQPIVERLRAAGMPRVGKVGAFVLISEQPLNYLPACFVVPERQQPDAPRAITGRYDQLIRADFLIYLIVGGERLESDAIDRDYDRYSALAVDCLAGWVHPDAEGRPTEFTSAELLSLRGRELGWGIGFRTYRRLTKPVVSGD